MSGLLPFAFYFKPDFIHHLAEVPDLDALHALCLDSRTFSIGFLIGLDLCGQKLVQATVMIVLAFPLLAAFGVQHLVKNPGPLAVEAADVQARRLESRLRLVDKQELAAQFSGVGQHLKLTVVDHDDVAGLGVQALEGLVHGLAVAFDMLDAIRAEPFVFLVVSPVVSPEIFDRLLEIVGGGGPDHDLLAPLHRGPANNLRGNRPRKLRLADAGARIDDRPGREPFLKETVRNLQLHGPAEDLVDRVVPLAAGILGPLERLPYQKKVVFAPLRTAAGLDLVHDAFNIKSLELFISRPLFIPLDAVHNLGTDFLGLFFLLVNLFPGRIDKVFGENAGRKDIHPMVKAGEGIEGSAQGRLRRAGLILAGAVFALRGPHFAPADRIQDQLTHARALGGDHGIDILFGRADIGLRRVSGCLALRLPYAEIAPVAGDHQLGRLMSHGLGVPGEDPRDLDVDHFPVDNIMLDAGIARGLPLEHGVRVKAHLDDPLDLAALLVRDDAVHEFIVRLFRQGSCLAVDGDRAGLGTEGGGLPFSRGSRLACPSRIVHHHLEALAVLLC